MIWPKYIEISKLTLFRLKLIEGIFSKKLLADILKIFLIYSLYILTINYIKMPFADLTIASRATKSIWIVDFIDVFFSGEAISQASIFSIGIISMMPFYIKLKTIYDIKSASKFTIGEFMFLLFISIIYLVYFIRYDIIKFNITHIIVTIAMLIIGAYIIRYINIYMIKNSLGDLNRLFVFIFIYKLFNNGDITNNLIYLSLISFIFLLISIATTYLIKKRKYIPISNVSGKDFEKSVFPISFVGPMLFINSISGVIIYSVFFKIMLDFFKVSTFLKISTNILNSIVMIILLVLIFSIYKTPSLSFSSFKPDSLSDKLKNNFWVFPNIRPGKNTTIFLTEIYRRILKRSVLVVLLYILIHNAIFELLKFIDFSNTMLRYDMAGILLISLTIVASTSGIFKKIIDYGKTKSSKNKWKYGSSAGKMITILEPTNNKEEIAIEELLLSFIDEEKRDDAKRILYTCNNKFDLIKSMPRLLKLSKEKKKEKITIGSFISISIISFFIAIVLFCLTLILMQVLNINLNFSNNETFFIALTFITFWIGVLISIIGLKS